MQENNNTLTRTELTRQYLEHHGIKGQRWGVRRYQNADGSLTTAGKKRRGMNDKEEDDNVSSKVKEMLDRKREAKKTRIDSKVELNKKGLELLKKDLETLTDSEKSVSEKVKSIIDTKRESNKIRRDSKVELKKKGLELNKEQIGTAKDAVNAAKNKLREMDENRRNNNAKILDNIKKKLGLDDDEADVKTKSKSESEISKKDREENYEYVKDVVLRSGSANDVLRFQGQLSDQELQSAVNRIRNEEYLRKLSPQAQQTAKTGQDRVNDVLSWVATGTSAVAAATGVYNSVATIANSFGASLPVMDGGASLSAMRVNRQVKKMREMGWAETSKNLGDFDIDSLRVMANLSSIENTIRNQAANAANDD